MCIATDGDQNFEMVKLLKIFLSDNKVSYKKFKTFLAVNVEEQ